MRIASFFSGIGGLELGLERATGGSTVFQCELNPYARRVLERHWPGVRRHDDITTLQSSDVPDADVWCGGFPCQDISIAGQGAGLDGERSGLWWEWYRLIRLVRPRYVVVENVAVLTSRGLDALLGALAEVGYDAEWDTVGAWEVGAPHRRDRVFVVAYLADAAWTERERWPWRGRVRQGGATEYAPDTECSGLAFGEGPEGQRAHTAASGGGWWSTEPDVGRVAHGVSRRVDRLRCLGNAVVPQVAEAVGRRLMQIEEAACTC